MKNLIKILLVFVGVVLLNVSCSDEDYSLGESYTITQDQFTFEMTPGIDEFTYDFAASFSVDPVKYPYAYEIRFGDKTEENEDTGTYKKNETVAKKDMKAFCKDGFKHNGSFEYVVPAGTYTAQCIVYTPNGVVTVKEKTIVIANDNPGYFSDDPNSLQFALTGGKDNVEGKTWYLGSWTAMRDPDNRNNVWWDFKDPAVMNDAFTFKPNSVKPNGAFVYENNGDSFMNESLGLLFPDGDPAGSFVTVNYNPPTDATWEVSQKEVGGVMITVLTVYKGFFGYAAFPADLVKAEYEVLSYSPSSIKLCLLAPDGETFRGWCYELINDAPKDPLTGEGSKTWVVDGYNKHLAEVTAALPGEPDIKGFMGLGPAGGGNQNWWGAGPGDKSYETTLATSYAHGWTLYDCKWTFASGGKLTIETGGEGYGRKASASVGGFSVTGEEGDDMLFTFNGGNYTYTYKKADNELTISDNGYLTYYCGVQTYEVLYLSETAMCVRVTSNPEGHNWVFILCPQGEE